jgi:hypothetical protein
MVRMTIGKGKRPRDPNRLAKWIVDRSTEEKPEPPATSQAAPEATSIVSQYMREIGRKGGQIGGKRRLKTMTKEQRSKVAASSEGTKRKLTHYPALTIRRLSALVLLICTSFEPPLAGIGRNRLRYPLLLFRL